MDKKQFGLFAMGLKGFYPKENLFPSDVVADLWYEELADLEYADVVMFLKKWVATEKWAPKVCEIREGVALLKGGELPDWGKGWEQVEKAIRYYGYPRPDEAMASMDEMTQEVVKRLGGFMALCQSEHLQNDRANFRMLYEQIAERKKKEQALPPALKTAIEQKRTAALLEDKGE